MEWFGVFWRGLVKADICMSNTGFNAFAYEVPLCEVFGGLEIVVEV